MAEGDVFKKCDSLSIEDLLLMSIVEDAAGNPCVKVCGTVTTTGGAGLSTEAKQDLILAELMKNLDFELKCVRDTVTGEIYVMQINKDITDSSVTVTYLDATGSTVVPPNPGDLVVCDADATLNAVLNAILATNTALSTTNSILQDIDDNTDGLETIAANALTELQAININTDTLEALVTAGNLDLSAISSTLSGQTALLNAIITILSNINNAVNAGNTANDLNLQAIQTQLVSVIADLGSIDGNTASLEASLTAIENAINTQSALEIAELTAIKTNTLNTVTELQSANATLILLNSQFSGTPAIVRVNISGNAAYVIPAGTYFSVQLYVKSGTVSDGTIPHDAGLFVETATIKGATHPGMTLDASGSTEAFVKLMTN